MGTTRALIISQTQKKLDLLGKGLSTVDTPSGDFHYPLNYALARMKKTDSDIATFSDNEERVAVVGTEYYVLNQLAKKYYGRCAEEGSEEFKRILQLLRVAAKEFQDALKGTDAPDSIDTIAEEIAVWGSEYGNRSLSEYDDGASQRTAPFHINEFGSDESEYIPNEDEEW